jgi:hypothetical protein
MSMVFSQFGNIGSIERDEVGLGKELVGLRMESGNELE